jgi:putative tryptophan/tyrosine transport system substrate-binding protein
MKRREFIGLIGGVAAWPAAVRAQQVTMPVIGFLSSGSQQFDDFIDEFRLTGLRQGLNEGGYVEGRNLAIEYRWANNRRDRLPALAADLVSRSVSVIIASGIEATLSAQVATKTIPVVFVVGVDPVSAGIVASLNHPGGNLTGVADLTGQLGPKQLQVLHEAIPGATVFAILVNPRNPNAEGLARDLQAAARALGVQLHVIHASSDRDFVTAFERVAALQVGGLVIGSDHFFNSQAQQLAALTVQHAVPAIHGMPQFAVAGGLISYGVYLDNEYHQAGISVARILKGENPSDLPVTQPTKVKLIINLKAAKMLGLTMPPSLLARADEVIE